MVRTQRRLVRVLEAYFGAFMVEIFAKLPLKLYLTFKRFFTSFEILLH